jgi:hypothetical protein
LRDIDVILDVILDHVAGWLAQNVVLAKIGLVEFKHAISAGRMVSIVASYVPNPMFPIVN